MDLYKEIILDHSKHPEYAGLRSPYDEQVHHINTSCGDEVTLRVTMGPDGQLVDVSYDAIGCSIMMASTSIMAGLLHDQPVQTADRTYGAVKAMLTSKGANPGDEQVIGDGVALAGVARYPARVKCALLPWSALVDALARQGHQLGGVTPAV